MNFLGLMDRDPIRPSFVGFKGSVLMSDRIQFRMPNVAGFLQVMKI